MGGRKWKSSEMQLCRRLWVAIDASMDERDRLSMLKYGESECLSSINCLSFDCATTTPWCILSFGRKLHWKTTAECSQSAPEASERVIIPPEGAKNTDFLFFLPRELESDHILLFVCTSAPAVTHSTSSSLPLSLSLNCVRGRISFLVDVFQTWNLY